MTTADNQPTIEEIYEGREHLRNEVVLAARGWLRDGDGQPLRIATEALEQYEAKYLDRLG